MAPRAPDAPAAHDARRPPGGPIDVGEQRSVELVATMTVTLCVLAAVLMAAVLLIAPTAILDKVPVFLLLEGSTIGIYLLNRGRHHRLAALLFCLSPVWANLAVGLANPLDPGWYALMPVGVILATALLRLRTALVVAAAGIAATVGALVVGRDVVPFGRGVLIVGSLTLVSGVVLGVARFRARVEALRRREVERLSTQLAATERLDSIGRMAGGVAHDFNNLLTVILASAEQVRRGHGAAVGEIVAAGERAAGLTRQLLAFSRHRAAGDEAVALDEAIAGLEPLLRRLVPENIGLALDLAAGGAVAIAPGQLEQVLLNLVANARDAMPTGGTLSIATATAAASGGRGELAVLTVIDTGSGMDEETRRHAFEPFYTRKASGHGTGLGLATVRGIVESVGGWIELASKPGAGTTVRIGLPRASPAAVQAAAAVAPIGRPISREPGAVLVVEDDPQVRRATVLLLESIGLEVVSAANAAEVERAMRDTDGEIALLVTDVVMPGQDGVELALDLRRRIPELPVLLVSGYSEKDLGQIVGRPDGRFLAKPFTPAALTAAVDELLAAAGQRRRRTG